MTQPRGIRNHNPGNIEKSSDPWQGLSPTQSDPRFFQFKEAVWGIRALARVLITYQDKHNLHTVPEIISRWAPPVENNTESYINAVLKQTGFTRLHRLDMHSFKHLRQLVEAIIRHENGVQPYTESQITKGLVLAGVEPEQQQVTSSVPVKAATVAGAAAAIQSAELLTQVSTHVALVDKILAASPIVLGFVIGAALLWIVYDRIQDRKKGLR